MPRRNNRKPLRPPKKYRHIAKRKITLRTNSRGERHLEVRRNEKV